MKTHILLFFLFLSAIGFSQDTSKEVPANLVKISLGETVAFKKATVQFLKVAEDSRCPLDTTCIWEGLAVVLVGVTETGKETEQVALRFGKIKNQSVFSSEGYSLKGMSLSPYPGSVNKSLLDYVLLGSEEGN